MHLYFANPFRKVVLIWILFLLSIPVTVFGAPPVNTVPGNLSASQNKLMKITTGISVSDGDGGTLTVTLNFPGSIVTLNTTTNLTLIDNDPSDFNLQFSGPIADLNNALADLSFFRSAAANAAFEIVSDDGSVTDTDSFFINVTSDNSLNFDGVDDLVTIPGGESYFSTGINTVESLVLIEDDGSPNWVLFEMSTATTNVVYITNTGEVVMSDATGQTLTTNPGTFPLDGNWHHLAIVDDGTNPEAVYVDGVAVGIASDNFVNFNTSAAGSLFLGDRNGIGGFEFSGHLEEFRVWSVARNVTEINDNMFTSIAGNETGLEVYYRMDQGTPAGANGGLTTLINNDANTGNDGTLTNFALTGTASNWVYGQNYFPSLTTDSPGSIGSVEATLGGNISDQGGNVITERGVVYAETANNGSPVIGGTSVTKEVEGGVTTGSFSENITGLTLNTNYSFQAYATNEAGTTYGGIVSFTTLNTSPPSLNTGTPARLTNNSVTLSGEVTADGGETITERGIVYSLTSDDADPLDGSLNVTTVIEGNTAISTFSLDITGLTPGETYSFKPYAKNAAGTGYGAVQTFTLASDPTLLPGDIAFTMINADNDDAFAFVALTTITSGVKIHFTDKAYDADISDFFTTEGIVSFEAGVTIGIGDQVVIDPNNGAPTATLKSSGTSAGNITLYGVFGDGAAGADNSILAFQGNVNSISSYAIGGFVAGILTDFSSGNMNATTNWTNTASNINECELPASLTNATNAISLFPAGGRTQSFHIYNFSTTVGTASEVRLAVNDLNNWNKNEVSANGIGDLSTFTINSPPVVTVPGDQLTDEATTLTFESATQISIADADTHSQTVTVSVLNVGNFTTATGQINVATPGTATILNNNTATVTIGGTLAEVNTALDGIEYIPAGIAGQHQITVATDDGNTGTDSKTILVNVSGTFDVGTNVADSGPGTFRAALLDASLSGQTNDIITFTGMTGGVIALASDLPAVAGTVTISGPGAKDLVIDGGGVHQLIRNITPAADLTITDLTLLRGSNSLPTGQGGAIHVNGINSLTVDGLHLVDNQATKDGGAVYINTTSPSSIQNSLIQGSSLLSGAPGEQRGGALFLDSDCNIKNTTIYSNTATNQGGAVFVNAGTHNFKHLTINANVTSGIYVNTGLVNLEYSIVHGNGSADVELGAGSVDALNTENIVGIVTGGAISQAVNVTDGSANFNFGTFANQGGDTDVIQIEGTAAVNAATGSGEAFDQNGNARPRGSAPDLGAYEREPVIPAFSVTWRDNNPADGAIDRVTITFDNNVTLTDANGGNASFDAFNLSSGAFSTSEADFGGAAYTNITNITVDITGLPSGTGAADFPTITYNSSGEVGVVSHITGDEMVNGNTPTTQTDQALPVIEGITLAPDNSYVDVAFSEPVFTNGGGIGALEVSDFSLSVTGGVAGLTTTVPTGITDQGGDVYRLTFDLTQDADGTETFKVDLFDGASVYDLASNAALATQSNNTATLNDTVLPHITTTTVAADNSNVVVTFNEAVYTNTGTSGALVAADFTLSVSGGVADVSSPTPSSITSLGGNQYQLGFTLTQPANGAEVLTVNPASGAAIFDAADNAAAATQTNNTVALNDEVLPEITSTTLDANNAHIDVTFSEPVYTSTGGAGALVAADFTLSVTGGVADVVSPTPTGITDLGGDVYRLTFTLDQLPNGSETLTVNPSSGSAIFDGADNAASATQSNNTVSLNDKVLPAITGVTLAGDNTYIDVQFSEPVFTNTGASGTLVVGDFTLSVSGGTSVLAGSTPTGITDLGGNEYRLTFTLVGLPNGQEVITVNPTDGASIFDGNDNAAAASQSNNTATLNDEKPPAINTSSTAATSNQKIDITVNVDEVSTLYYAIYTSQQNGGNPTPADVRNAANSPSFDGNFAIPAANTNTLGTVTESFVDNQQYYIYIVAQDGSGNLSSAVEHIETTLDVDAPVVNAAPALNYGPDSETQIKFTVNLDENATVNYLIREVSTPPSKAEILSGTAEPSDIAGTFNYTTPNIDDEEIISTLTQNVTYYVYWYAVDNSVAANETAIVDEGNITTTQDVSAPGFDGTTGISNITATSFDITADLDDAGTVFYIVILDDTNTPNAKEPTAQNIVDGVDGTGGTPVAKGSIGVSSASTPQVETISFLQSNTRYDVYMVAQDANLNRSPVREDADVQTLPAATQTGDEVVVTKPAPLSLCIGEGYTALGEIKLQEANSGAGKEGFTDVNGEVTLILTLPEELEFNTSANVTLSDDGGNDDWDPEINTVVPVITSNTFSIAYTVEYDAPGNSPDRDELKINGLEVRAVEAFDGTKSLLRTGGTAVIVGIVAGDGTSFADFSVASASTPPADLEVVYCTGDDVDFADFASNSNADYVWYSDFTLSTIQHTGTLNSDPTGNYSALQTELNFDINTPGTTTLYVTNTASGQCESQAVQVDIVVNPSPVADAGFASQTVCAGEELFVGGFPSLETPTVGGTYIYQWRSEAALRALDETFDAGLGAFTATGTSPSGPALAFDNSANALRIAAGEEISTPTAFKLFDSDATLFFYGRAESTGAVGATLVVSVADNPSFTGATVIGTVTTNQEKYLQYSVKVPAAADPVNDDFYLKIEFDNSGGEDVAFILDELILDKGLTNHTEAVRSNPFFFPPSNSAGGGDLSYDLVLTIHDPNYCSSTVTPQSTASLTIHDKIDASIVVRNQDLLEIAGSVDISSAELILDISPAAAIAPPDPRVEFIGTAISYDNVDDGGPDNGFGKYEFFPNSAGEGTHGITYIATDEDNCEESVSTSIVVVSSTDFDNLVADECRNVDPYDIVVSTDLLAEINSSDTSSPSGSVDYEFDHIRYGDNTTILTAGSDAGSDYDFVYDPEFQYGAGGNTGKLFVYITRTTIDNSGGSPMTSTVTGQYKSTPARVYNTPNVFFENLPLLSCEQDGTLQLAARLKNFNSVVVEGAAEDKGTYEIKPRGASDASYVTITNGIIDFDNPMGLGAGTGPGEYTVRYTSHPDNDPNPNFATGCTNEVIQDIEIIDRPTIPSLNNNPNYATSNDPAVSTSLEFGKEQDGNGNDVYKFVYCKGEPIQTLIADFTDVDNDKIQDAGTEKFFRWYDNDGAGNPDFSAEIPINTQSGANTDRRFVTQSDLFFGTVDPGTYVIFFTQTDRRTPFASGATFEGCESQERKVIIEVLEEPLTQDLTVGSGYFDDVTNSRQVREYCVNETVQPISVDISTPSLGGDEIVWYDENGVELFTTTNATVTPQALGLGSGTPGSGTNTPAVRSQPSNTGTLEYTTSGDVPSFIINEFAVGFTQGQLQITQSVAFQVGEIVTSETGGQATVVSANATTLIVNNITGFFGTNKAITGNLGGVGVAQRLRWSSLKGYGRISNFDGNTLELIDVNNPANIVPGDNLSGNSSNAQAYITSFTLDETILPYTFYYARRNNSGEVTADGAEGDFVGCDGPLTRVDIIIYPKPDAPQPDAVFDDNLYACVGDVDSNTDLFTSQTLNRNKEYLWYENASGGVSFDKNDITLGDLPSFDFASAGTTTYYLSEVTYSDDAEENENVTPGFAGCESDTRTPVNITLFAKPDAPSLSVKDGGGNPISEASTPLPNSQVTYRVCAGDIDATYTFETSSLYAGANGHEYDWWTANPSTGGLVSHIGTYPAGTNPTAGDLDLIGATGTKYFGITQTTDIVSGGDEFPGCTGDPIVFAFSVQSISGTPAIVDPDYYLCFGEEVQAGDITVTGEASAEFYWYSDPTHIGNPAQRLATTNQPSGTQLNLSAATPAGDYTYYVTQAKDFDRSATPSFEGCETPQGSHLEVTVHIEAIQAGPVLTTSELNRTICQGENFTAVTVSSAQANSYQWYRDALGTDPIAGATGASYLPVAADFSAPEVVGGKFVQGFSIYVGQFTGESDCPSNLTEVELTVHSTPTKPVSSESANADTYEICQAGTLVPMEIDPADISAGDIFIWYSDAGLNTEVFRGTSYTPTGNAIASGNVNPATVGSKSFYVTRTTNSGSPTGFGGCEGPATEITYTVNPLPALEVRKSDDTPLPLQMCVDDGTINIVGGVDAPGLPTAPDDVNTIGDWSGLGITDGANGAAVFDPVAAVGDAQFLDQSAAITLTFTYTDEKGCSNSIDHVVTVNGLPSVNITLGREGEGAGKNEFCIDDNELILFGNPIGASGVFTNAINNSAIDNTVGNSQAEIDLRDAFETVNPAADQRQIDYVVTFTYTDGKGCQNSTDITIKINNTPEPDFTIARPAEALSSSTAGIDVEVCIDDVSKATNLNLAERITLQDNTDPSMGTLTTGTFTGQASGVPLSAAALAKNVEGEYYFYPEQAVADAVAGNPVAFSNSDFIDFTIDYTFTNDLTCAGKASDFANAKIIRVYRLPAPVISINDDGPNNDNEFCIDHGSLITFSTVITHNPGGTGLYREVNGAIDLEAAGVIVNAAANGMVGSADTERTATFDTEAAYTYAQNNGLLNASTNQAVFTIIYEYETSIGCANTSNEIKLTINPYPTPSFTYEQGGVDVDNEVCVDEGTITLRSALGEGNNATFTAVGFTTDAITDRTGSATIEIEKLFKDAVAGGLGTINDRFIEVDINLNYQNEKSCSADVVQSLIIHNLPVPTFDIQRNDGSSTSLVSGGIVEVCASDPSTSDGALTDRILLIDNTDQLTQGVRVEASFAELNFNLTTSSLENVGTTGQAYFYPLKALETVDLNPALRSSTFIDFKFDMSYKNDKGCTGKTLSSDAANGVQDFDNTLIIRVYRSPSPTIKIDDSGSPEESIAACVLDGASQSNRIRIYRESVGFEDDGSGGKIPGSGVYTTVPALSTAALSAPSGTNDEVFLDTEQAYAEHGNGIDPLVVSVTYTYTSAKTCGDESNTLEVTINPLPTVDFTFESGPVAANPNEFCVDSPNIILNATALEGDGSDAGRASSGNGLFSTPFSSSGLTTTSSSSAQFNFEAAYNAGGAVQDITYTFTDGKGCVARATKQVIINTKPVVQIDTEGGCDGSAVEFQFSTVAGQDPGDAIVAAQWNFDDQFSDDDQSNELQPSYSYVQPGEYVPTLFVTNAKGCVSTTVSRNIQVGAIPDVNFDIQGLCDTDEIVFTASPESISFGTVESITFDFGDGSPTVTKTTSGSTDFVVGHMYDAPDTYEVELLLTTNNNCDQIHTRLVTVLPTIVAPYFNDFNSADEVKKDFVRSIRDADGNRVEQDPRVTEDGVTVSADGWYVDLRPLDNKDEPDEVWGKLPSEFNSWQFGVPAGVLINTTDPGNKAWATNLDGNYLDGESRSWVYSPCFDFRDLERPMVSFDQIYHFSDQRDGVVLQYSTDGGSEWVALGDYDASQNDATGTHWFTNENITGKPGQQELQATNEGDIGWAGNKGQTFAEWVSARHKLDVIDPANRGSVIFRFALGTDGSAQSEGFAFDNFAIKEREKNVLLEQFSSTNMSASATVDSRINAIVDDIALNNGDVIRVNYHTSFKGDLDVYDNSTKPPLLTNPDPVSILNVEDPSARAAFYGISTAPTSLLDGEVNTGGAVARTEVPWSKNTLARKALEDAMFDINISPALGTDEEVLDVSVQITAKQDLDDDNDPATALPEKELIVYIAIVENTVALDNAANGQVETRSALRKMLPNGIGTRHDPKQYTVGTGITVNESWEITKGVDADDLTIVVFVQDLDTKAIYQANSLPVTGKTSPTITGLEDALGRDYQLYPNPADNELFVVFDQPILEVMNWAVYDQTGKIYKYGKIKPGAEGFSLETKDFPSGMYFLSVNGDHLKFSNKKLMITH